MAVHTTGHPARGDPADGDGLLEKVVLATDGSEGARAATRAAVGLAGLTGADLHVAHAWQLVPPHAGYPSVTVSGYEHLYEREARRVLDSQADAVEALGGTVAETHLLRKPPIDAILDLCEELVPDLLLMGSRGLGTLRRVLVGSVSESVVHHARCPVLVVRGGEGAWPPTRVVVGHDGSEDAEKAVRLAAEMARLFGAGSVLVRAHQGPPKPIGGWTPEERNKLDGALIRAENDLNERAEQLASLFGDGPKARIVEGDPTLALLKVAEEGDGSRTLLAMGSRGPGDISRIRLGSVPTNVLRVAHGPILICPHRRV